MASTAGDSCCFQKLDGMGFIHDGIPTSTALFAPWAPENAVKKAFDAGHVRITKPLRLVLLGVRKSPLLAAWQLTFERDVPIRAPKE